MPTYELKSPMPVSADTLYEWHMRAGALERLIPPWRNVEIKRSSDGIAEGSRKEMIMPVGPFRKKWIAVHHSIISGRQFCDELKAGPFARWIHYHRFIPDNNECILEDEIYYKLPYSIFGQLFAGGTVRHELNRLFPWRHRRTRNDNLRHQKFAEWPRKRIAISGASGLIGQHLKIFLESGGHVVYPMVRKKSEAGPKAIYWNPDRGEIDANALNGLDAVINLAGENVGGLWTEKKKKKIYDSRVKGTTLIANTLAKLKLPPEVFICSSAVGYYGDGGSEPLTEESGSGDGFLPRVCRDWEAATIPAKEAGIRVVNVRTGIVISARGGMVAPLLPIFRLGFGATLGSGQQFISWISIDDLLGIFNNLLFDTSFSGPVNATSPNPITNRNFAKSLGRALHRPVLFNVPAAPIKIILGQMAREGLLPSQKIIPKKLIQNNFEYFYPAMDSALCEELGSTL